MIKVMTFNIRYGTADDGENRWENRKSLVIERIKAFEPDLLGLQECRNDAQAEFIRANLPGYEFLGIPRGGDNVTTQEMAPILFKRSAFHPIQWEIFWLSETPHIPGSKSWDSAFPRTVLWTELTHLVSGRSLVFLNTHFDYEISAIHESARLLKDWIHETVKNKALLVTGDFNADKSSVAYQYLTTGIPPLTDIYRDGNPDYGNEGTFHAFGTETEPAPIDWILTTSHFKTVNADIDRYHQGKLYPSDHYPITATLEWKES